MHVPGHVAYVRSVRRARRKDEGAGGYPYRRHAGRSADAAYHRQQVVFRQCSRYEGRYDWGDAGRCRERGPRQDKARHARQGKVSRIRRISTALRPRATDVMSMSMSMIVIVMVMVRTV